MGDNITNREDVFLGKIAGRDVDISTWTPPVANGVHEKILEEIADRIDSISESSLPEIEEGDEGKVLGVSNGSYALVNGGGGGGSAEPLICEVEYSESAATLNKKFSEIKTAYLGGTPVLLKMPGSEGYNYTPVLRLQDFGEQGGNVMFYEMYDYSTDSPDGYPAQSADIT